MNERLALHLRAEPGGTSIPERFAQVAQCFGKRTALQCDGTAVTWAGAFDEACRVNAGLDELGVPPGDCVAILAGNGLRFLTSLLGIVVGGRCVVTLPTLLPAAAIAGMLKDCAASVLFADAEHADAADQALRLLGPALKARILLDGVRPGWQVYADWVSAHDARPCRRPIRDDSPFNIVYSSGTTGAPKGIVHSQRTRATMAAGFGGLGFDENSVNLIATPLYTNLSLPAFLATLWGGGRAVLMRKFDVAGYLQLAQAERATHFFMVPVQVQRLLNAPSFSKTDLSATRLKYVAGSRFEPTLKQRVLREWPGPLVEVYGMTEGAPISWFVVNDHPDKISSVGRAPPGVTLRILGDDDIVVAEGDCGEIVGRSGSMMLGYSSGVADTQRLIWKDEQGLEYFRSGDMGRLDADGFLYILDRKKDVIISGGFNIYASDIEELVARHPAVVEVAVVGVPSEQWGESPVAVVVPAPHSKLGEEELKAWTNARLGKFQRLVEVVFRPALPRNALGKVIKTELRNELRG